MKSLDGGLESGVPLKNGLEEGKIKPLPVSDEQQARMEKASSAIQLRLLAPLNRFTSDPTRYQGKLLSVFGPSGADDFNHIVDTLVVELAIRLPKTVAELQNFTAALQEERTPLDNLTLEQLRNEVTLSSKDEWQENPLHYLALATSIIEKCEVD